MIFHTFGDKANKAVIFVHGMLNPWQIWTDAIEKFKEKYYVIVPELDGHTQSEKSAFLSVDDEAAKITEYIKNELGGEVFLLAGLSMGGRIAATVAKSKDIKIEKLVLDGAPLARINGLMKAVFKKNYKVIIARSKAREPKILESAKKDFLPEKMIPFYLNIADNMEEQSIDNMIDTVFTDFNFSGYPDDMRILFMHGTKGNEQVSRKCALKMKKANPQTEIRCFEGFAHAELACFKPEQWTDEVERFIS
ncbi:MAG: alpha/beta hydrolase [Ruminococcaceae bacterium]|nr:alpha/beta hydrolase [Oscillospiraceae bacterium]